MTTDTWLSATGTLRFARGTLRVTMDNDIARYYKWFLERHYRFFTDLPAHGAHISVWLPTKHRPWSKADDNIVRKYLGTEIPFDYDPYVRVGGFTRPYRNFMLDIRSPKLDTISKLLVIEQDHHLTIANTKNGTRPYIFK